MTLNEWEKGGDGTGRVDIVSFQSSRFARTFDYVALRSVLRLRLAWVLIRVMFGAPS
jgi:hypothetical protein